MKRTAIRVFGLVVAGLRAQTTPPFGVRAKTPQFKALVNARIVISSQKNIWKGTLVIKDGRTVGVEPTLPLHMRALTWEPRRGMTRFTSNETR